MMNDSPMFYAVPTSNPFSLLQEIQEELVLSNLLLPGNSKSIVSKIDAYIKTLAYVAALQQTDWVCYALSKNVVILSTMTLHEVLTHACGPHLQGLYVR